jgi:hypothetical protein
VTISWITEMQNLLRDLLGLNKFFDRDPSYCFFLGTRIVVKSLLRKSGVDIARGDFVNQE